MAMLDRMLPIGEAGKRFGVPRRTLDRRVQDGTLVTYQSDRDRRVRLVALDDVLKIFTPRPTSEREPLPFDRPRQAGEIAS
jgi:predicted DNA-binding protein (UPF0251 family)